MPSDHLGFSFGEEIDALRDVSIDSGIEQIGDVENQSASIIEDLSAGRQVNEEYTFLHSLGCLSSGLVICPDLQIPIFGYSKARSLSE